MFGLTVDFIYLKDYASDGTDAIGFVQPGAWPFPRCFHHDLIVYGKQKP